MHKKTLEREHDFHFHYYLFDCGSKPWRIYKFCYATKSTHTFCRILIALKPIQFHLYTKSKQHRKKCVCKNIFIRTFGRSKNINGDPANFDVSFINELLFSFWTSMEERKMEILFPLAKWTWNSFADSWDRDPSIFLSSSHFRALAIYLFKGSDGPFPLSCPRKAWSLSSSTHSGNLQKNKQGILEIFLITLHSSLEAEMRETGPKAYIRHLCLPLYIRQSVYALGEQRHSRMYFSCESILMGEKNRGTRRKTLESGWDPLKLSHIQSQRWEVWDTPTWFLEPYSRRVSPDSHPSSYQAGPIELNFGEQMATDVSLSCELNYFNSPEWLAHLFVTSSQLSHPVHVMNWRWTSFISLMRLLSCLASLNVSLPSNKPLRRLTVSSSVRSPLRNLKL